MQQTTLARSVEWRGIGLHGGAPAAVVVRPAPPDAGLFFVVASPSDGEVRIPALPTSVHSTARATTLAARVRADSGGRHPRASSTSEPVVDDGARERVATVEHLLAALFALGIHNARIEVDGGEVPVLDGSASPFVARLRRAGVRGLGVVRRELEVRQAYELRDGDRSIRIEPGEGLSIDYAIEFANSVVGRQRHRLVGLTPEIFESEIAPARTFGFAAEVEALRAQGLARGGDLSNTLVVDDRGLLNPGGLRWPDELVRHKIVDLLGDLALLGAELHARITVERGGHALHHALVRALVEENDLLVAREPARSRTRRVLAQPG